MKLLSALLLSVLCLSCTSVRVSEDPASYRSTMRKLEARLVLNPKDAEALRDLGVIYFQTKRYPLAQEYLQRALAEEPGDAKALFYLGMALEYQNNRQAALAVYLRYDDVTSSSPYRKLLEGRYQQLTQDMIEEQFRSLVAQENALSSSDISSTTVAVYPLYYEGTDERYSALGKGITEMLIIDLAQVKSIKVVERVRMEALLQELKFGQSKLVDPGSAPRLGKLLKAGRMVTGAFNVSESNFLRLDVALWDVVKKKFPDGTVKSDPLDNLFKLEKELVFSIVERMGIKLTTAEREKIQFIPTKNLQAFMAYSLGLEREDARDFRGAAVYFNQAAGLDAQFTRAQGKAAQMEALGVAGGDRTAAYTEAKKVDPPLKHDYAGGTDVMTERLKKIGGSVGSGFVPGEDNRKPVEEATGSGAGIGQLPEPPKPPGK